MSSSRKRSKSVVQDVESVNQNVFSKPWKKSDVILVVQSKQFHVHRSILTMQSPVFEAMLDGHFKEASQDKITLEGKTSEDMQHFLKLLYPLSMINETVTSFADEINDRNVLKILALADEYQARDVMIQCLKETKITRKNAFIIRPYAIEYNKSVYDKCTKVIVELMRTTDVEKELEELDKQAVQELLIAKCLYLESKQGGLYSIYGY